MGPVDLALAPLRVARGLARAAEDLHVLAERARRDPDPVEMARKRVDRLSAEVETLLPVARSLNATAQTIVAGGRDLRRTGEVLDGHTQELIDGGSELTEVAKELAESLRVSRAALPRLLEGLDTVEELEDSVGAVAETVEPLTGVAQGVGRMSGRLARSG